MPVVFPPITTWDPHTGVGIDTQWDHKDPAIKRILPPTDILREVEATANASTFTTDASRCEVPVSVPICVDGNAPEKKSSWNIFELWRWSRQAVQSAPQRVIGTLSPTLSNFQYFLSPGRYLQILNFENRPGFSRELQFAPHPSEVNDVVFAEQIRVSGGGRIALGSAIYVLANGAGLQVGDTALIVKDRAKYLKVINNGVQYGLKLEVL